jgi:DNA-binding response OmpR family regulator
MARILIIEDEDKLRRALRRGLEEVGYDVVAVEDGESGLARAAGEPFDCLILDLMLPGRDGLQVLNALRTAGCTTRVLILSARGAIDDRVRGLDSGADDYLSKPFAWSELLARVRVCLRRGGAEGGNSLRVGDLELDCIHRLLACGGPQVELTMREFELLEYLMRRAGQVVSRDQLARNVWRDPNAGLTNVIDVYVNYVRKKLEKAGSTILIRPVRGVGYSLQD